MKKLIIFDLDGTLINTLVDLKNAVNTAILPYKYEEQSDNDIRIKIGNGVAILISRCIPNGKENPNYENILFEFRKYYTNHCEDNTKEYDGIRDILINLKQRGYKLAVCTNKLGSVARPMIKKVFGDLFDYVQGDEPEVKVKPAPDMINKTLSIMGVNKEETLYIGDTNVDEETALNSSLDYILVTYGYRTLDELQKMCPSAEYASMDTLLNQILVK